MIGIFLTFALAAKCGFCKKEECRESRGTEPKGAQHISRTEKDPLSKLVKRLSIALAAVFLIGNVMTTEEEFRFGKYRKEHNRDEVKQILLNFENESDKTLEDALEYHKPGCREALTVLKENGWNIWR